tara:strand:- start:287 stop:610 length:324 start_codon:yes stop_codon:yes gene_type:complete
MSDREDVAERINKLFDEAYKLAESEGVAMVAVAEVPMGDGTINFRVSVCYPEDEEFSPYIKPFFAVQDAVEDLMAVGKTPTGVVAVQTVELDEAPGSEDNPGGQVWN